MAAGIYCIETDWWENPRRQSSVEPILQLLRTHLRRPYVRRDVSTDAELEFHLREWSSEKYSRFPYLYLAVHGAEGKVHVKTKKKIRYGNLTLDLEWLKTVLKDRCEGRVVMFASCSTVEVHGKKLNSFLKATGAKAVLGYQEDVDWLEATTFELALFAALPNQKKPRIGSLRSAIGRMRKLHSRLAKRLAFRSFLKKT